MTVESVSPEATPRAASELREPPVAGGGNPLLGHGLKLARDPLAFMAQLRAHGDVVRLRLGPKTVYAVTTPDLTGALAVRGDGRAVSTLATLLSREPEMPRLRRALGAKNQ